VAKRRGRRAQAAGSGCVQGGQLYHCKNLLILTPRHRDLNNGLGAASKAANFITELDLEKFLAAAASVFAG
jgi:hypothetical protein